MARAIITCQGQVIDLGDKVRTDTGRVITVEGAAIGPRIRSTMGKTKQRLYNAEACHVLPKSHVATGAELHDTDKPKAELPPGVEVAQDDNQDDYVVWGG